MRYPKSGNYRDRETKPRIKTTDEKQQDETHLEKKHAKVKQWEACIHQHVFVMPEANK